MYSPRVFPQQLCSCPVFFGRLMVLMQLLSSDGHFCKAHVNDTTNRWQWSWLRTRVQNCHHQLSGYSRYSVGSLSNQLGPTYSKDETKVKSCILTPCGGCIVEILAGVKCIICNRCHSNPIRITVTHVKTRLHIPQWVLQVVYRCSPIENDVAAGLHKVPHIAIRSEALPIPCEGTRIHILNVTSYHHADSSTRSIQTFFDLNPRQVRLQERIPVWCNIIWMSWNRETLRLGYDAG